MKKDYFYEKMKAFLGEKEAVELINALEGDINKGIRVNLLKIDSNKFVNDAPFKLEKVSWCEEGFYYNYGENEDRPSKHPFYYAGLYYLQEPSAMLPVEAMNIKPGDIVLDISAAPGGKSTQIAAKLQGQGLLVSNDINPKRAIALQKNISMFGVKNAIVLNQKPEKIAEVFSQFFSKVLVDAPCSGEGLMKKDIGNYETNNQKYVEMQKNILLSVARMVRDGGELVYSTCTFSPEENEGIIKWFIEQFPEFQVVDIDIDGLDSGKYQWVDGDKSIEKTRRAWPHKIRGEGHFLAKLKKKCMINNNMLKFEPFYCKIDRNIVEKFIDFVRMHFYDDYQDDYYKSCENLHCVGNDIWIIPKDLPNLQNIKALSTGIYVGEIKANNFIPSQELAMSIKSREYKKVVDFDVDDLRVIKYLKGETIEAEGVDGWNLVCVNGYPLGFGKMFQGMMKNYYKKQWRMM